MHGPAQPSSGQATRARELGCSAQVKGHRVSIHITVSLGLVARGLESREHDRATCLYGVVPVSGSGARFLVRVSESRLWLRILEDLHTEHYTSNVFRCPDFLGPSGSTGQKQTPRPEIGRPRPSINHSVCATIKPQLLNGIQSVAKAKIPN